MAGAPKPASVADRDAELAALQSSFDDYIASSRELEEELDAELAKMQKKLHESSSANAALVGQLEMVSPQLSSLEKALSDAKNKYEKEKALRLKAEIQCDDAENHTREIESSYQTLKDENDALHEEIAFKSEELDEMRDDLEVTCERYRQEIEELKSDLNVKKNSGTENGSASPGKRSESGSTTETYDTNGDDTQTAHTGDDAAEYIRSLEDELELVTEQLIDTQQKLTDTEVQLRQKDADLLEVNTKIEENLMSSGASVASAGTSIMGKDTKLIEEYKYEIATLKEELELTNEELTLTQEELKAAEEDAKVSVKSADVDLVRSKENITNLQDELAEAKAIAGSATVQVETMEKALQETNVELQANQEELRNLFLALQNAKEDHRTAQQEVESLNDAFIHAKDEAEAAVSEKIAGLQKDLNDRVDEISKLKTESESMTDLNNSLRSEVEKLKENVNVSSKDIVDEQAGEEISEKLRVTEEKLARSEGLVSELTDEITLLKGKVTKTEKELEAAERALAERAGKNKNTELNKNVETVSDKHSWDRKNLQVLRNDFSVVTEVNLDVSSFSRSHARSRKRNRSSRRARSSSPSVVCRLESESSSYLMELERVENQCKTLRDQYNVSQMRTKRLESDLEVQKDQMRRQPPPTPSSVTARKIIPIPQKQEVMIDMDLDADTRVDDVLKSGDHDRVAEELRSIAKKSNLQREHNAQLLGRILRLQGNIQVCCRVRPMKESELVDKMKVVVEPLSETEVGCFDTRTKVWKSFAFDKVWGPDMMQSEVYHDVEPLALSVVDGYNACIFAYGQTGSGKTFTMEGSSNNNQYGISPRTIQKIFYLLNLRSIKHQNEAIEEIDPETNQPQKPSFEFSIKVGMLEIYNDEVYDLLKNVDEQALHVTSKASQSLQIRHGEDGRVEVPGLTKESVNSLSDVLELLERGNSNRSTASTSMNAHSSRSHMVLHVEVSISVGGNPATTGNLFLVDLAGSERVRKSNVEGKEMKEAQHINKSLSALGDVMEALDRKASHIPFRNSKLTYLLQDCLGGNSKTMMVVACCPTDNSFDETLCALQFATRVRRINLGSAQRNVTSKNLEETIKALTTDLKMKAKAKEKAEQQTLHLKRENERIQERLAKSQEQRSQTQDDSKAMAVLRKSSTDITARWQKEKSMREEIANNLENTKKELRSMQNQIAKVNREKENLSSKLDSTETLLYNCNQELRKTKDEASAMKVRARRAEITRNASKVSTPRPKTRERGTPPLPSSSKADASQVLETKKKVLSLLQQHEPSKVKDIGRLMERWKGNEAKLLQKIEARYEGGTVNEDDELSIVSNAGRSRSELALLRHQARMKRKNLGTGDQK